MKGKIQEKIIKEYTDVGEDKTKTRKPSHRVSKDSFLHASPPHPRIGAVNFYCSTNHKMQSPVRKHGVLIVPLPQAEPL